MSRATRNRPLTLRDLQIGARELLRRLEDGDLSDRTDRMAHSLATAVGELVYREEQRLGRAASDDEAARAAEDEQREDR